MRLKLTKLKLSLQLMVVVCSIIIIGNSCSFTKSMMSKGRPSYDLAQQELSKGHYIRAIRFAADAVDIDPKIPRFQEFIYINFPEMENRTNNFIESTKNTTNIADAEKRYEVFSELVEMYKVLERLNFPLEDKKNGEWSFTTNIKDYSKDVEDSRQYAYELIMKVGADDVAEEKLKDAHSKFKKAYGTYVDSNNKEKSAKDITTSFLKHCNKYKKSGNIEKLITVHEAYNYILYYSPFMKEASDGANLMKITISDIYFSQGTKLFASKSIDKRIKAIDSFKNSIKWNRANKKADEALKMSKEKLAEYYYSKALTMSKIAKSDRSKVIELFREAQKWVTDYKDSMYRIYSIKVNSELKTLKYNLARTRKEYNRLSKRIVPISNNVNKCQEALNSITVLSDNIRNLDSKMKEMTFTLTSLKPIPKVGTVAGFMSKVVKKAKSPVHKMVLKFNKVEKPVVKPVKLAVGKIKIATDRIKGIMASTGTVLSVTETTVGEIDKCIMNLKLEEEFKRVEVAIKEMNKGVKGTADELTRVNNSMDSFRGIISQVARYSKLVNAINNAVNKTKPAIDKIGGIAGKINGVLQKEIGPMKVSVHKVLTTASVVMKPLMKVVDALLSPLLNKLKIDIPKIPGMDQLHATLDQVKQKYSKIKAEADKIYDAYRKYTDYERMLKLQVNKIVDTTGCGVKLEV